MTDERLAELTEPPWGGTPLERELLQALKAERERVEELEAENEKLKRPAALRKEYWNKLMEKNDGN